MPKLFSVVLAFMLMTSFAQAQYKGKYVGWSTGYVYSNATITSTYGRAFTHLVNFHITLNTAGDLSTGDLKFTSHANFISQSHANGCKALLCIGGQGEHDHFKGACASAATQTTLVKNIMNMVRTNGYDGVDLDWEVAEDNDGWDNVAANQAMFLAFHKQVHDSIKAHPPLLITAAVTDDWYPHCSAEVCSMMDQANSMSYDQPAANELNDANSVFSLGAPKANHGIGFDMNSQGAADNLAKCRLAIDNAFGGVMMWAVTGATSAFLDSLARYVNPDRLPISVTNSQMRVASDATLLVRCNKLTGANEIFFTVPSSGSGMLVDLSMYDVQGRLVGTILHGMRTAGSFVAPITGNSAGTYVFRLSENTSVQSTKAFVVK